MQHNTMQQRADRTALSSDNFAAHPRNNYPISVIGRTKTAVRERYRPVHRYGRTSFTGSS